MREIDTSADGVGGYAHNLEARGFVAEAAALRGLAAERDECRALAQEYMRGRAESLADRDRLAAENARLRAAVTEWIADRRRALSKHGIVSGHAVCDLVMLEQALAPEPGHGE